MEKSDSKIPIGYTIIECASCGNMGLHKILTSYTQEWIDYCDGEPDYMGDTQWDILECPVCQNVSLYRCITNNYAPEDHPDYKMEEIVYPVAKKSFPNTPKNIVKSYEAAVKTLNVDSDITLLAVRRVLEMICKERGCKKKTLEAMLKEMVGKNILPETLDKCGFLIRKLGNSGAHGDDAFRMMYHDLVELLDFIETIIYYIYELPVKIEEMKKRYDIKEGSPRNSGKSRLKYW